MLQEAGELTTADQWGQGFSRSGDAAIVERKLAIDGEVLDAHIRKVHQDPVFLLDLDNLRSGITLDSWTERSPKKQCYIFSVLLGIPRNATASDSLMGFKPVRFLDVLRRSSDFGLQDDSYIECKASSFSSQ